MSSKSSNAVLAKARAMYGRSLKDSDYRQLAESRTVPEIASYLKTRTSYGKALAGLVEGDIHRGQLEPLLKQELYLDIYSLSRYTSDNSVAFSDFIISKMEIEQIIRYLMLLNINKPEDYAYSMPLSLDKFADISFGRIARSRSYDDLLTNLRSTKYFSVLKEFRPRENEKIKISEIELALNKNNYGSALDAMSKAKGKAEQKELKNIFTAILDFENLSRILRLKKYYSFEPEKIKEMLIPYGKLSRKTLEEMCDADSAKDVLEIARNSYMGKNMSKLQYSSPNQITDAMRNIYCKHHLRLSSNPTIVMISYVYLKEIELHNIVNIIEATRYGLSVDEKLRLPVR